MISLLLFPQVLVRPKFPDYIIRKHLLPVLHTKTKSTKKKPQENQPPWGKTKSAGLTLPQEGWSTGGGATGVSFVFAAGYLPH